MDENPNNELNKESPHRRSSDRFAPWILAFYAGFVLVAIVVFVAFLRKERIDQHKTDKAIIQATVNGCERTNQLRRAVNDFHSVLRPFMVEASIARRKAGLREIQAIRAKEGNAAAKKAAKTNMNLQAARIYAKLANKLRTVPIPNCIFIGKHPGIRVPVHAPPATIPPTTGENQ